MDLANMPLFSAITRKMNWLTQRQQVLAQNVANVDVPGFRASDLKPLDFGRELSTAARGESSQAGSLPLAGVSGALEPVTTDPSHIGITTPNSQLKTRIDKNTVEREPNGNTVSMEEEMMKVSETASDYQLMTNLYKKQVGLISMAIGRGS